MSFIQSVRLSACIGLILLLPGCSTSDPPKAAESLGNSDEAMQPPAPEVQSHRGGRGMRPENTLQAFRWSHELGDVAWEMDVAVTADLVPVLSHDPFLRGTLVKDSEGRRLDDEIRIADLTLKELKNYLVGTADPLSRYGSRYSQQHGEDETMPTLAEVLALSSELGGRHRLNIEIKTFPSHPQWTVSWEEAADAVLAVLEEADAAERTTIQSFDWRTLEYIDRLRPDITIACLTVENFNHQGHSYNLRRGEEGPSPWLAGRDVDDYPTVAHMVADFGADIYSPYYKELSEEELATARSLGLKVLPWTVNNTSDMRRLIGMGVDGIISDYPDQLLALLEN